MEIDIPAQGSTWRWPVLLAVVILNICIPSLILSYGVQLVHIVSQGYPTWLGLATPALFILTYGLTQCWCREAADSWGGLVGYRFLAAVGLALVVIGLLICAFTPLNSHPFIYGILGGLGSSLLSAQVDALIYETYDSRLGIIRSLCFAGQAVGQSIFPHIISALINCYGYSYSYIVLAGIMLQTLPAVMLLKTEDRRRPLSFSRYSDISKTYAIFGNVQTNNYYTTEFQLHDMTKKCWQSPSDDNLHRDDDYMINDIDDGEINTTITPPPSPEEKRRNIFGVEILPEIPEESEMSDDEDEQSVDEKEVNKNKNRLSVAIKRLSTMGDNLDDYIIKQTRRDSQSSRSENREYSEVEVTYDNISPITDIEREKILNSFSFRCQAAYANMRRRFWTPSYRMYRLRRRTLYLIYNINDTFFKPLTRSLLCWKFYPSLFLCLAKLGLTVITLTLLPILATKMQPKISMVESNFLMTLHGFTWICFLLSTPWLAQTSKNNFKYITVMGLMISTGACLVLATATSHDAFSIGCVVAGVGYGAISSCWETSVHHFVGPREWPKLHSTLETLSSSLLVVLIITLAIFIDLEDNLREAFFVLTVALSVVTFVWLIIAAVSLYITKLKSMRIRRRWIF